MSDNTAKRASGGPPPEVTMYKPDLRLGYAIRQVVGFDHALTFDLDQSRGAGQVDHAYQLSVIPVFLILGGNKYLSEYL